MCDVQGSGRLWQGHWSLDRCTVVTGWLSGIAGANGLALWLTMLPCAWSRGRFGDDWIPMSMSFGAEAEGAARASAGERASLLHANPKL
eukprot:scaffold9278_cov117-Isochrysis_galbana.AAC.10